MAIYVYQVSAQSDINCRRSYTETKKFTDGRTDRRTDGRRGGIKIVGSCKSSSYFLAKNDSVFPCDQFDNFTNDIICFEQLGQGNSSHIRVERLGLKYTLETE